MKTESMAKKLKLVVAHILEAFEVEIRLVANFKSISVASAESPHSHRPIIGNERASEH